MNIIFENQVNIEKVKKELQKTIDGLKMPYKLNGELNILTFRIIGCGYIFGTNKTNKENHELLRREIAEIKGIEDIPAIIKKARNMYSKVITENPELPFYMIDLSDIEDFLLLQNKKFVEVDIPNRQLKYEDDNGDIVKFHIYGEMVENTKVNEIKIVLTNELRWKVLIPYKDNFIKDEA